MQQTYKNFELVIINDNSAPETESVIDSFGDPRIVHIKNKTNVGAKYGDRAHMRRFVYEIMKGEFFLYLCDDDYLHALNLKFLKHDTNTDVITFDYSLQKELSGDIYVSIDRVKENAQKFGEKFNTELSRVMVHGFLHLCGYADKKTEDKKLMRNKENYYLSLLL